MDEIFSSAANENTDPITYIGQLFMACPDESLFSYYSIKPFSIELYDTIFLVTGVEEGEVTILILNEYSSRNIENFAKSLKDEIIPLASINADVLRGGAVLEGDVFVVLTSKEYTKRGNPIGPFTMIDDEEALQELAKPSEENARLIVTGETHIPLEQFKNFVEQADIIPFEATAEDIFQTPTKQLYSTFVNRLWNSITPPIGPRPS